ncbi:hypothetical protein V2J09_013229 [Rumex salicifolius]
MWKRRRRDSIASKALELLARHNCLDPLFNLLALCRVKKDGVYHTPCSLPGSVSPVHKKISMESQAAKCSEIPSIHPLLGQKVNVNLQRQAVGAERASRYLWNPVDSASVARHNLNAQTSLTKEKDKPHMMSSHYENGLFSSSLSELFSRNDIYGHSVDTVASHFEEEEPLQSLKEIEAQTIGNLLPDDDDLFSGVTGGLEQIGQSSGGDDIEDVDFFSSIGGMDLGDDNLSGQRNSDFYKGVSNFQLEASNISVGGEHPSRTLFVRNINNNIEDPELKTLFEQYGDIHTLYTACKHRGFVMISYYDIRSARNAMKALQNKSLRHRNLDIHYSIPKDYPSEKDVNQGTLVVFNLDSSVLNDELHRIFGVYGEIKEIHETPHISDCKFIEFYDMRAAEAALHALNQSEIAGKRIQLELSRQESLRQSSTQQMPRDLEQKEPGMHVQHSNLVNSVPTGFSGPFPHVSSCYEGETGMGIHTGMQIPAGPYGINMFNCDIPSSVHSGLMSPLQVQSPGNQIGLSMSSNSFGQTKFNLSGMRTLHPHSLPDYHDGLANGVTCNSPINMPRERTEKPRFARIGTSGHSFEMGNGFGSSGNGNGQSPGHYSWTNSNQQDPSLIWPNSISITNGVSNALSPSRIQGLSRRPLHMMNSLLSLTNHHAGSAPAVNPLWDRRTAYPVGSPEPSSFHQGSLGSMRLSGSPLHQMEYMSHNVFPRVAGNCVDLPIPSRNGGLHAHQQRCMVYPSRGQMNSVPNSFDHSNERPRNPRSENSSQADKKQFELDVGRILRGEDTRTTLMIKNIPNKYTSKMLMAAIDERHRGTYDFIYLPIDFKTFQYSTLLSVHQLLSFWQNKCNVGYAFINMIDPNTIVPFFETLNGKKWEKFNSEKVASLAYARIQGKTALIAHFQNSSLMNEDKRCRPILFHTDGPNAGDQVPFPMGVNVRTRPGKCRTDDNNHGSPTSFINKEDSSNLDSNFDSGKEE